MTQRAESFVTLVTNDAYAHGALVLGSSLTALHTTRDLTVLITATVTPLMREHLAAVFDHVVQVEELNSNDTATLALINRPELGVTITKIAAWKLTQYTKCVFLDADTLPIANVDDLFERPELSAAADIGWPDCFNSGVFVFVPSEDTYNALLDLASREGSFDGGDQGLLNQYFNDWATGDSSRRLPFVYNMTANAAYTYVAAYKRFADNVKIIHFLGALKPWHYQVVDSHVVPRPGGPQDQQSLSFVRLWWNAYFRLAQDQKNEGLATLFPTSSIHQATFNSYTTHNASGQFPQHLQAGGRFNEAKGSSGFNIIQNRLDSLMTPAVRDSSFSGSTISATAAPVNPDVLQLKQLEQTVHNIEEKVHHLQSNISNFPAEHGILENVLHSIQEHLASVDQTVNSLTSTVEKGTSQW